MLGEYLRAFLAGGLICALGQILVDKTRLTPARILSGCVVLGVVLGAVGVFEPLSHWAGAGVTVPLLGFGALLASGVKEAVATNGAVGILTGGLRATSGGIAAAIFFAFLAALLVRPREKR